VRFGEPPPCDLCKQPSVMQVVTLAFEGPSPPDKFLCRQHASTTTGEAESDGSASHSGRLLS
jgi:hypothetical protein